MIIKKIVIFLVALISFNESFAGDMPAKDAEVKTAEPSQAKIEDLAKQLEEKITELNSLTLSKPLKNDADKIITTLTEQNKELADKIAQQIKINEEIKADTEQKRLYLEKQTEKQALNKNQPKNGSDDANNSSNDKNDKSAEDKDQSQSSDKKTTETENGSTFFTLSNVLIASAITGSLLSIGLIINKEYQKKNLSLFSTNFPKDNFRQRRVRSF